MAGRRLGARSDRGIVLWVLGGMVVAILLFSVFGPRADADDPSPTTFNTGTAGVKAALLLLPELGYGADRWQSPLGDLGRVDAARTTLVLTEPVLPVKGLEAMQKEVEVFLRRGGRVVATGKTGAELLPGGLTGEPTSIYQRLCVTTNEGTGKLGAMDGVRIAVPVRWAGTGAKYRVAQRCGKDAVVVEYGVGKGTAVWWSSPMPMTNGGLKQDGDVALLLASVGEVGRTVLFDEYVHEAHETVGNMLGGLPWWAIVWQCLAVAVLLVLSRGRRNGPVRVPVGLVRNSPVEFAESMGHLYEKAGATSAATDAALEGLMRYLREECGVPAEVLRGDAAGIGEALRERFGGDWTGLVGHVEQGRAAAHGGVRAKSALGLVQALERDLAELRGVARGVRV